MKVTGLKVPKTGVTNDNPNKILTCLLVLLVLFLVLSAPAANM